MLHLSQMSFVGVCKCAWACPGVHGCRRVWASVCRYGKCARVGMCVCECARVCMGEYGSMVYMQVCVGMHGYARVCIG